MSKIQDKEPIKLDFWTEVVGELSKIFEDEIHLYLKLDNCVLSFKKGSREAEYIKEQCIKEFYRKVIAVLRTDIINKPILIRLA